MKKTMVFIKTILSVSLMLFLITTGTFLGFLSYEQGYINGEKDGSLFTAQYIASACHQDSTLTLFGNKYHCGKVQDL